ncbi:MAG: urease accessory protein UreD [Leptolyngbyaceae cyanobacterium SM2_5_2]|nr:urease accessory protein UreD [Leptolyngbyaceae cyanobacterium SM2_5_2]
MARLNYTQRQGKCVAATSFTQAPLKVQRPLYPEGPEVCHSVLVHTAGGVVRGDGLTIQIALDRSCRALVTTAAAHKIYSAKPKTTLEATTPTQPEMAQQRVTLTLAPESCLEWFPQETIVFSGAQYHQDLRVNLTPGALWCGWEITRFGRSARGERFTEGNWRSRLEVWQDQQPLWIDRQRLIGGSPALDSANGLGGHAVVGSFALVGLMPTPDQVSLVRNLWDASQSGDVGVTRLESGLLCRYRGPSSEAARRWFIAAWQHLRPWYLGRSAVISRIWPS